VRCRSSWRTAGSPSGSEAPEGSRRRGRSGPEITSFSLFRRLRLAGSVASSLAVLACLGVPPSSAPALDLDVQPVPLNPESPGQASVGPLRFRGGLVLRSPDPRFGGLSDLRVDADGSGLVAVSDCGHGFVATLVYDAHGDLAGLRDARLVDLLGPGGRPLSPAEIDAEAMERQEDGLLVGFEGRARVWRYRADPPFAGPPQPVASPPLNPACRGNRGLESIAALGDGRFLFLCEGRGLRPVSAPGWVGAGEVWRPRAYPLDDGGAGFSDVFRPTSAARLPDGDVLVLERRYPPLGARLRRLTRANVEGAGPLAPRTVAELEPPLSVDNFEGLAVRPAGSGRTLLYLLSDDNGCAKGGSLPGPRLQRTLLLLFELDG
jgi:hypothetical protein